MEVFKATGRRKNAIARIYMSQGTGTITVNSRKFEDYFPFDVHRTIVEQPLAVTGKLGQFDLKINVRGGGVAGQAEAIRHGISRALVVADAEMKPALKTEGFMTRDPRMVERKKYGRRKARRKFQFSKR
jgi:small subunit ribosomal protein S9